MKYGLLKSIGMAGVAATLVAGPVNAQEPPPFSPEAFRKVCLEDNPSVFSKPYCAVMEYLSLNVWGYKIGKNIGEGRQDPKLSATP